MTHATQSPQIQIHQVDGSVTTFTQSEAGLADLVMNDLQPARIFHQEKLTIAGSHSVTTFISSLVTRVDLITGQLSVWDFPFVIGALLELTETEFREFLFSQKPLGQTRPPGDYPLFLEIEMINGQRSFLWMEVIAGFPADLLPRACSLLKERNLIFGLRPEGIGILNPATIARCAVHPDPSSGSVDAWHAEQGGGSKCGSLIWDGQGSANPCPAAPPDPFHPTRDGIRMNANQE